MCQQKTAFKIVVCLICLSTYLIQLLVKVSNTVCRMGSRRYEQTTFVVIGALRVEFDLPIGLHLRDPEYFDNMYMPNHRPI